MGELIKQMSTPAWWISVVIVGVLVNIFSDYLKLGLDRFFGRFSAKRKHANERERIFIEKEVQELLDTPSKVIDILAAELRSTSSVLSCFIINSAKPFLGLELSLNNIIGLDKTSWIRSIIFNAVNLFILWSYIKNANVQKRLSRVMREYRIRVLKN
jgi:uncharacterized membrane protein YbhN (UPF0104 family)